MKVLKVIKPKGLSVSRSFKPGLILTLKRDQYRVEYGYSITGDQPKQFIRVYTFEPNTPQRKAKYTTWPLYIAKTAEKWYPTESITEHLLNRIGEVWGMPMAKSRLVWANGQIRFLSRYFLAEGCEDLAHGADILAGFFNNDTQFIEDIEKQRREREFISVQVFELALRELFPNHHASIFSDFIRMLLFDALVGNNDRHFWNYGVIRDLTGRKPPRFSPIYDSARGLLWNTQEKEVVSLYADRPRREQWTGRYVRKSQPKISWDGKPNITHIAMVELIAGSQLGVSLAEVKAFYDPARLSACFAMIDREFTGLLSPERLHMIKRCLQLRIEEINKVL